MSQLFHCPYCGKGVTAFMAKCPGCQQALPPASNLKPMQGSYVAPVKRGGNSCIWWVVGIGAILWLIQLGSGTNSSSPSSSTEQADVASGSSPQTAYEPPPYVPPANAPTATLSEFNRLRTGMSYSEACEVIGGSGEVMSESEMMDVKTVLYTWEGEGTIGANMNAMFQNDELVSKAQFGLE